MTSFAMPQGVTVEQMQTAMGASVAAEPKPEPKPEPKRRVAPKPES
jgi:hypothetical protein